MSLGPGSTLGPFKIRSLVGKGGMGEVFCALDTRLDRQVALKILPPDFATDSDRLRRFEAEAKTLASINHPNILVIHEVGAESGNPYLVSELLEGRTLREELTTGALPIRKATDYALQIANGLAAAHSRGIVHRDLKPENIFITKDGRVKILDFGIAKLSAAARASGGADFLGTVEFSGSAGASPHRDSAAPTVIQSTVPGMILGTPGYMSPEQVRGELADHRSDIFALGCTLYEMLSGKRPFAKPTAAETAAAVLNEEPFELPESIPSQVKQITSRCLEKAPERRFQSVSDLAFALQTLTTTSSTRPASAPFPPSRSSGLRPALIAALVIVAAIVAFKLGQRTTRTTSVADQAPTRWRGERLDGPSIGSSGRISPNGEELAFMAMIDDQSQIGLMVVDSGNWRILTTNRDRGIISDLSWSADGSEIYYDRVAGGPLGVYRIPKLGGEERLVVEAAMDPHVRPDGSVLVARRNLQGESQLHLYSPDTDASRPLNGLPESGMVPSIALFPDGSAAVFRGRTTNDPSSRISFWRIDLSSGVVEPFLTNVTGAFRSSEAYPFGFSRDGARFIFDQPAETLHRILSVDLTGKRTITPLLTLTSPPLTIDLDRSGTLYLDQSERPNEIFRQSQSGDKLREERSPLSSAVENRPVLPLPGNRFLFASSTRGAPRLMVIEPGKEARPFLDAKIETSPPFSWLGSNEILFTLRDGSRFVLAAASVQGRGLRRVQPVNWPSALEKSAAGSPDGRTVFYSEAGFIYATATDGGTPRKLCVGHSVAPHPDGEYLIVMVNSAAENFLLRYSLLDQTQKRVGHDSKYRFTSGPLASNAVGRDGRILVQVAPLESWYWPAAVLDPRTGGTTLVTEDPLDMFGSGWDSEGRVVASAMLFRSSIWRFRPEQREASPTGF